MIRSCYRGFVLSSLVVALMTSGCSWFQRSSEPAPDRGAIDSPGADVTFANDQKKARDEAAKAAASASASDSATGGVTTTPLPADSNGSGAAAAKSSSGVAQGSDSASGTGSATAGGADAAMSAEGKATKSGAGNGAGAMGEKVTLQGDALFQFGKADEKGMLPGGKQKLDELADKIIAMDKSAIDGIMIVGHADRLGSSTGNMKISEKRAATVMKYLERRGVDATLMQSAGKGDAEPVMECPGAKANKALIACLSPNRRVEVIINAK